MLKKNPTPSLFKMTLLTNTLHLINFFYFVKIPTNMKKLEHNKCKTLKHYNNEYTRMQYSVSYKL